MNIKFIRVSSTIWQYYLLARGGFYIRGILGDDPIKFSGTRTKFSTVSTTGSTVYTQYAAVLNSDKMPVYHRLTREVIVALRALHTLNWVDR